MNKTESSRYVESVNGIIIGGEHSTGQLYHQGRPQGRQYSGTAEEITAQAKADVASWKTKYGPEFARLYPNGLELRIWD